MAVDVNNKTAHLVSYLAHNHPKPSVTVLMKLCYLIDLVHMKQHKNQISDFEYIRYMFGPFDKKIYSYIEELGKKDLISEEQSFASETANDFIVVSGGEQKLDDGSFSKEELESISLVLKEVEGYGAKALTDIAYKTRPMLKIGATRGGSEHLFQKLDLTA